MNLFEWKDSYSVDILSIDNDHQGLLKIINQLFEAMSHGKASDLISEYIIQLLNYTKTHFEREEYYFSTTNYPDTFEHKLQHQFFIEKIQEFKTQLENGDKKISIELIKFLSDWLINHIIISDKKYMVHLKNNGAS